MEPENLKGKERHLPESFIFDVSILACGNPQEGMKIIQ